VAFTGRTVKIWDPLTGECLRTFAIGTSLSNIAFDPSGSYLLTEVGPVTLGQSSSVLETASESGDEDATASAATVAATSDTGTKAQLGQYSYGLPGSVLDYLAPPKCALVAY